MNQALGYQNHSNNYQWKLNYSQVLKLDHSEAQAQHAFIDEKYKRLQPTEYAINNQLKSLSLTYDSYSAPTKTSSNSGENESAENNANNNEHAAITKTMVKNPFSPEKYMPMPNFKSLGVLHPMKKPLDNPFSKFAETTLVPQLVSLYQNGVKETCLDAGSIPSLYRNKVSDAIKPSNSSLSLYKKPNYQYSSKSIVTRIKGCLTWDGYLPPRTNMGPYEFCRKVFLGGVPWDTTEQRLFDIFGRYGNFQIDWPNNFHLKRNTTKSFLYLIFDNVNSLNRLLNVCRKEQHGGSLTYYYQWDDSIHHCSRAIQVIPWIQSDDIAIYSNSSVLDSRLTVFLGALHGRLYAESIGHIFQELFQNVAYVQIDTDRYKYPIGSGRLLFSNQESYRKAIEENHVTIIGPKFSKRIQIEPYIEDQLCGKCEVTSAPNFCKSRTCFDYFCDNCWEWQHAIDGLNNHIPVKRNRRIEM